MMTLWPTSTIPGEVEGGSDGPTCSSGTGRDAWVPVQPDGLVPPIGPLILIVENDRDTLEMLEEFFHLSGFRTLATDRGHEALQQARRWRPDVILTDTELPDLDGFRLSQCLHHMQQTREIPIIALTSYRHPALEDRARQAGIHALLRKACTLDAILMATRIALP